MAVLLAACDKANRIAGQRASSSLLKQPIRSSTGALTSFFFSQNTPSSKEEQGPLPCRESFASEETRA